MPTPSTVELPPPTSWQEFEAICRDLWRCLWNDPGAQMHGRQGQPQHGVDVFGRPEAGGEWAGVQCKLKSQVSGGRLRRAEIEAEVEKARSFNPRLTSFIIATTTPRDAEAQEVAREITAAQLKQESFPVTIASWEDVSLDLASYPDLLAKHYPGFQFAGSGASRTQRLSYLRALWSRHLPLPLMGVGGGGNRGDIPLSAVYTALDVKAEAWRDWVPGLGEESHGGGGVGGFGVALGGEREYLKRLAERLAIEAEEAQKLDPTSVSQGERTGYRRRCTAVEAAAAAPRLVLLGQAGSGKSSFARHLVLCLAGEELGYQEANLSRLNRFQAGDEAPPLELWPWPHKTPLPVFLELKKLVRSEAFSQPPEPRRLLEVMVAETPELAGLAEDALAREGGALLVLDGLDETPAAAASRERLKELIGCFVRAYPECRVIVTSRPYAYAEGSPWRLAGQGFEQAELAALEPAQSQAFIDGWYAHLAERGQVDAEQATRRSEALWQEITATRYLPPLAKQPLMLTMMTDLHATSGGRLRGGRAGLYERSLELLLDRWNEVRDLPDGGTAAEQLGMDVEEIRCALERLAYEVHKGRGAAASEEPAEISHAELWQALDRERSLERVVDERRVMDYLHQRSGILLGESPTVYRFPHRSYQEYLAACYLIREDFPNLLQQEVAADPALWRETTLLAAGKVAATPFMVWSLLGALAPDDPPTTPEVDDPRFARVLLAGLAVQENRLGQRVGGGERRKLERIRCWLEKSLEVGALSPVDRAAGGRVLGQLGDRRPGVGLKESGVPDVDWVSIPSGRFLMGSSDADDLAYGGEKPQHEVVFAKGFQISRFPVTNAQYRAFVADGGYSETWRECWTETGWQWKGKRNGPGGDSAPDNHPRVNITWYEACAFCRWLSEKLAHAVRLPTEEEWEKAARGSDGRLYPWGETFDALRCNVQETGIGQPTAVGAFPTGVSPYGVLDMSGNVWEWTLSAWVGDYAGREEGVEVDPRLVEPADLAAGASASGAARVIRGGCYWLGAREARSAYRVRVEPQVALGDLGFRVVLPAAPSGPRK